MVFKFLRRRFDIEVKWMLKNMIIKMRRFLSVFKILSSILIVIVEMIEIKLIVGVIGWCDVMFFFGFGIVNVIIDVFLWNYEIKKKC